MSQTPAYQLSQKTDSIVQLLSRDLGVPELIKVLDELERQKPEERLNDLKDQLVRVQGDERLEMKLNELLGRETKWAEQVRDSYQYYTRALYLAEKLRDDRTVAIASFEIANNIRLGTVAKRPFESYFQRAIDIFETLSDPLSESYLLYAKIMMEQDQRIKSGYMEQAITRLKSNLNRSDTLMMESLARHLNAAGLYEEGLSVAKAVGNNILQAHILNNIGYGFRVNEEYDNAIPYHLEALDVAIKAGIKGLASNALNNLSICYRSKGMYKEALDYYHAFVHVLGDITNDNYYESFAELEVKHEVDRVELKNELLQSEQKLQSRQRLILFIISLLLLLIVAFVFWSRRRITKTNEKLQALDKAKSRFFANISHELRTPLTLINAPLESLIQHGKIDDPEVQATLETATRNGVSLLSLVEEILDLAKLDGGKLELVKNPVRVNDFLTLILSDYKSGLDHKSIQLKYEYQLEEELAVLIDEGRCTKVINNLLSNAMKFTPEGGSIVVTVSEDVKTNTLKIAVQDTGIGIHPNDLPFVFDRYYQSEQPGKKAEGGTGIGLALSKELAELHGGRLSVESELEKGSTFTFELPIKKVQQEAILPLSQSEDEQLGIALNTTIERYAQKFEVDKPVLLITEDHPEMRAFIAQTLAPYFEIKQAENGKIALDILNTTSIDIVISDVMMPVMDGFELLEAIRKDENLRQVSLVMLTARADHQDKLYALTLGIDDYLTKPFSASEFLARIKNILDNRIKIIREFKQLEGNGEADKKIDLDVFIKENKLSDREIEILEFLAKRKTNTEIAELLFVSTNTVKYHIKNLYAKLNIKSRLEVAERIEELAE